VFNNCEIFRDFTYIDDIVAGTVSVVGSPETKNDSWDPEVSQAFSSYCPYRILNIGNDKPTKLMGFIKAIEAVSDIKEEIIFKPVRSGDVVGTAVRITKLHTEPKTDINKGMRNFVD